MIELEAGHQIDRYVIERVIGRGGMAVVYKVRHTQLDSIHALKVLAAPTRSVKERLIQEGRAQAKMRHPNLVAVTDVLDVMGAPGLIMEFVDGPSLKRWLQRNRPDVPEALDLFRGIVRGVRHAHRRGLVHRDLKPTNVVLQSSEDGLVPKITDFGLVKALHTEPVDGPNTRSNVAMGTPEYMAPEQIRDAANVDQRADIWALGCILYEIVTGHSAFQGDNVLEVFNRVANARYTPPTSIVPDLPPGVERLLSQLLEVDPILRVPDCEALLDALDRTDLLGEATGETGSRVVNLPTPPALATSEEVVETFRKAPTPVFAPLRQAAPQTRALANLGLPVLVIPVVGLAIAIAITAVAIRPRATTDPGVATETGPVDPGVEVEAIPPPPPPAVVAAADPNTAPLGSWLDDPTASVPVGRAPRRRGWGRPSTVPSGPSGGVTIEGDVRNVWLVRGDERLEARGRVPVGTWSVVAEFDEGRAAVPAGSVTVREGASIRVRCASFLRRCVVED